MQLTQNRQLLPLLYMDGFSLVSATAFLIASCGNRDVQPCYLYIHITCHNSHVHISKQAAALHLPWFHASLVRCRLMLIGPDRSVTV